MITDISMLASIVMEIFSTREVKYYFIVVTPICFTVYIICAYKVSQSQKLLSQIKAFPPSERLWVLKRKMYNASLSTEIAPEVLIKKQIRHHYCIAFTITFWLAISLVAAVFFVLG